MTNPPPTDLMSFPKGLDTTVEYLDDGNPEAGVLFRDLNGNPLMTMPLEDYQEIRTYAEKSQRVYAMPPEPREENDP